MISVQRYEPSLREAWDDFIRGSKNATFLFERAYMDYHADRFADHSLMISVDGKLEGVLPANRVSATTVCSHSGLTYGSFAVRRECKLLTALKVVSAAIEYLHAEGVTTLNFKRIPRFYSTVPADEIDYALFLLHAELSRRDTSMIIRRDDRLRLSPKRLSGLRRAEARGMRVVEDHEMAPFWGGVLESSLMKHHNVAPVHEVAEISLLKSRFPNNIRQFSVYDGDEIVAGTTVFVTESVVHFQYTGATDLGREFRALDLLVVTLLTEVFQDLEYFDFGICNEREGRGINQGLLTWKESFGARCLVHEFYEIDTQMYPVLQAVIPSSHNSG